MSPALLALTWLILLGLGSIAPQIVWRAGLHGEVPYWASLPAQIVGLLLVLVLTWLVPALAPLRGLVWSVAIIQIGYQMAYWVQGSATWTSWTRSMSGGAAFVATEMLKTIPTVLLMVSLIGSGLGRLDVFLTPGDLQATSAPTLVTGAVSWARLGPILAVIFALPLALYVAATRGSDLAMYGKAIRLVPLILAGSVVNAFNEEFLFRAVLLARLIPLVGRSQSLWLTSFRFGIGHWFGNPSGATGVGLATVAGWFWGKSILETRGLFWACCIHAIQDVVIYSLIAMHS